MEQFSSQARLFDENQQLKQKTLKMEETLARLNEIEKENTRLKELLQASRENPLPSQMARVIYHVPGNWYETLLVDKGKSAGIKENMVVLSTQGLIGKVVKVDQSSSLVRLITDPQMEISAINQRSRDVVILQGNYNKELKGKLIPPRADLQVGDMMVTSGLGGVYPKGVPIGTISWISRNDADPNPKIKTLLSADLNHLEEVLILSPTTP